MSSMDSSDPTWSKDFRESKDVPWYVPDISAKVTPPFRKLLEDYSGVAPASVIQHVHHIRDQAWAIRSYPCTGLGGFTSPTLPLSSVYSRIVELTKRGGSFLDVGCFVGHDLRRLVSDGSPSARLVGVDIVSHWDVGYNLFRDRGRFEAHFEECDILAPSLALRNMAPFDAIAVALVLHQWSWEQQLKALLEITKLASKEALVVGIQVGSVQVDDDQGKGKYGKGVWHDPQSFQKLWSQVSDESGTSWKVKTRWRTWEDVGYTPEEMKYLGNDARMLEWVSERTDG